MDGADGQEPEVRGPEEAGDPPVHRVHGQPRDEESRAAYAFVDTDEEIASIRRVEYDIASVQRKIHAAGLPEVLANRLSLGV